eukprot:5465577-Amphidinium_carterae.1
MSSIRQAEDRPRSALARCVKRHLPFTCWSLNLVSPELYWELRKAEVLLATNGVARREPKAPPNPRHPNRAMSLRVFQQLPNALQDVRGLEARVLRRQAQVKCIDNRGASGNPFVTDPVAGATPNCMMIR